MKDIQFTIEERYSLVGFDKHDEFEVSAFYLTREESEEVRVLLFDIIRRRK